MGIKSKLGLLDGKRYLTPEEIAHHDFFSRQEKLDVLHELKAEASGAISNDDGVGYTVEEIESAIAEVKSETGSPIKTAISDRVTGR